MTGERLETLREMQQSIMLKLVDKKFGNEC